MSALSLLFKAACLSVCRRINSLGKKYENLMEKSDIKIKKELVFHQATLRRTSLTWPAGGTFTEKRKRP